MEDAAARFRDVEAQERREYGLDQETQVESSLSDNLATIGQLTHDAMARLNAQPTRLTYNDLHPVWLKIEQRDVPAWRLKDNTTKGVVLDTYLAIPDGLIYYRQFTQGMVVKSYGDHIDARREDTKEDRLQLETKVVIEGLKGIIGSLVELAQSKISQQEIAAREARNEGSARNAMTGVKAKRDERKRRRQAP